MFTGATSLAEVVNTYMVGINPEVRTDVFSIVSGAEFIGRSPCLVDLIHVPEGQYDSALRATFKGEDLCRLG